MAETRVTKDGLRTSESRDTPGRTLCPLADGDTSDLCRVQGYCTVGSFHGTEPVHAQVVLLERHVSGKDFKNKSIFIKMV